MKITDFKQAVERHWQHHAMCQHLLWKVEQGIDCDQIEIAPVFQEVVGGEQDGMTVWSGFRFDFSSFLAERGVLVDGLLASSYCQGCSETPHMLIKGSYFGESFLLKLHLEPIPNSEPVEIIDTLKKETRAIKEKQL